MQEKKLFVGHLYWVFADIYYNFIINYYYLFI
jgi:hypothetical protein